MEGGGEAKYGKFGCGIVFLRTQCGESGHDGGNGESVNARMVSSHSAPFALDFQDPEPAPFAFPPLTQPKTI